ncbi:Ig-like domain-containing protein [Methanobrevibacter sp.]|uniref:Ig-like domain-containing protein n=1 Tax=Methanobrevibacter sp. TaxID=66852 RepID=UPI00389023D7
MICSVSASDLENETIQSIEQPDPNQDLCKLSVEDIESSNSADDGKLKANENEKLTKQYDSLLPADTKAKVSLSAPDVKMYYKDGSKFKIKLKDTNTKKAINKAKIQVTINGKTYDKVTDKKGTASLNLKLNSGTYTALTTFAETSIYESQSVQSTVTIKSTIKCSDFEKYYKNKSSYYAKFYDKKGKLLKNTSVKFKLNGKSTAAKTNNKGIGKLAINLDPGKYDISVINSKTSETIKKTINIKSLIETSDLTLTEGNTAKFNVKILNSNGKASPNKKVTLKLNGKSYTKTTNKNGIASLDIDLIAGTYKITAKYGELKSKNKITVNPATKAIPFSYITQIPNYVNITHQYVFEGSGYVLKSGPDGIIKMPKNEVFTIQIKDKEYLFSTNSISGVKTNLIGYKYHLVPFDGGKIQSDANKDNLKGNGIIISAKKDFTEIEYRSQPKNNTELFGFYADKGGDNSEIFTYMEDDLIKAKISVKTINYDELGLKYSLSKFYGRSVYDFNYKTYVEYTYNNTDLIRFANTNKPVTLSIFGNSIAGYPSKEEITTKFVVNGIEEVAKNEVISYGLGEKYRKTLGFEVLQAYSIINEKITKDKLEHWLSLNPKYLDRFGIMNVYGMHLASLETTWLADELADKYSKEFNVTWKRSKTLTILGGINLEDTYLNILNADMGMKVKGNNETNKILFRLINSINLPNLEDYALSEVAARFWSNTTNSFDNVLSSILNGKFSIAQIGEMIYLLAEDGSNCAIALNTTTGVASVIMSHANTTYKGSSISTSNDCCSVGILPKDIISGIRNAIKIFAPGIYVLSNKLEKIHPFSILAYQVAKFGLGHILKGSSAAAIGLFTTMTIVQTMGATYKDKLVKEKDWYALMDTITFTRPGYLQGKKIYNIPNKNGGYDYIEVTINDDLTLNRSDAKYISQGKTKKLSKKETYQYFTEDYWTPFSMPTKYWNESWKV